MHAHGTCTGEYLRLHVCCMQALAQDDVLKTVKTCADSHPHPAVSRLAKQVCVCVCVCVLRSGALCGSGSVLGVSCGKAAAGGAGAPVLFLVSFAVMPGRAPGTRHQAPGTRHQAPGTRHRAPGTRHQAPGTRHRAPGTRQAFAALPRCSHRNGSVSLSVPEDHSHGVHRGCKAVA